MGELNMARARAMPISPAEVGFFQGVVVPKVAKGILDPIAYNPAKARLALAIIGDTIAKTDKAQATPAMVCNEYVRWKLIDPAIEMADEFLDRGNMSFFALWHDLAAGGSVLVGAVRSAHLAATEKGREILDSIDINVASTNRKVSGQNPTPEAEAKNYLYMEQERGLWAELLKKDPSGLLVLEYELEQVKTIANSKPLGIIPEIFTDGAFLAYTLYRSVYPLTL